jgi:hypothetical protein
MPYAIYYPLRIALSSLFGKFYPLLLKYALCVQVILSLNGCSLLREAI